MGRATLTMTKTKDLGQCFLHDIMHDNGNPYVGPGYNNSVKILDPQNLSSYLSNDDYIYVSTSDIRPDYTISAANVFEFVSDTMSPQPIGGGGAARFGYYDGKAGGTTGNYILASPFDVLFKFRLAWIICPIKFNAGPDRGMIISVFNDSPRNLPGSVIKSWLHPIEAGGIVKMIPLGLDPLFGGKYWITVGMNEPSSSAQWECGPSGQSAIASGGPFFSPNPYYQFRMRIAGTQLSD